MIYTLCLVKHKMLNAEFMYIFGKKLPQKNNILGSDTPPKKPPNHSETALFFASNISQMISCSWLLLQWFALKFDPNWEFKPLYMQLNFHSNPDKSFSLIIIYIREPLLSQCQCHITNSKDCCSSFNPSKANDKLNIEYLRSSVQISSRW